MEELKHKDQTSLIYLDETGIDNNETYPYAWGQKGPRIHAMKNAERTQRLSIISVLHEKQIKAPFVFEGTCDRAVFEVYLEKILLPSLTPGQTIIMDNAAIHKGGRIKSLLQAHGCNLQYLPPYSPDLNPIEHRWASIKHSLRKLFPLCNLDSYAAAEKTFQFLST